MTNPQAGEPENGNVEATQQTSSQNPVYSPTSPQVIKYSYIMTI